MRVPPMDRRRFVQGVGAAMAAITVPKPLLVKLGHAWEPVPPIQDSRLRELTARAVDAARAAGAAYADARLTHARTRQIEDGNGCVDGEDLTAGVRALVNGFWGYASGPIWAPDEMARLGGEAVHQARANALGETREVTLAPAPLVADGHWTMPIGQDPFEVSPLEVMDFLGGLSTYTKTRAPRVIPRRKAGMGPFVARFVSREKAFASSDGSYCTQQLYDTFGDIFIAVANEDQTEMVLRGIPGFSHAGLGWEMFTADRIPQVREHPVREEVRRQIEAAEEDLRLPWKPVDVGRYEAALDAASLAALVAKTLELATEIDRGLGYEANEDGTTFVTDPFHMLGSLQVGSPLITLTGDRSTPGGAATVKWDDEGVAPDDATLVKAGVLNDFQTVRESAGWLKERYAALGRPWRSHGYANAPSALAPPMQFAPNLTLAPGAGALDYDKLVAGLRAGLAIEGVSADMDFQASTGVGDEGRWYKVERGRKTARLASAAFLFRSTEFWKSVRALGGEASLRRFGMGEDKGEPEQTCAYSLTAPPAMVRDLSLIDDRRKA